MFVFYSDDQDTLPAGTNTELINIDASQIISGTIDYARLPPLNINEGVTPPFVSSISTITPSGDQTIEIFGSGFLPATSLNIPGAIVNSLSIPSPTKIVANISKTGLVGTIPVILSNGENTNQIWGDSIKTINIFSDLYWINVALFIKGNGENNSINIIDNSQNPKQLTRSGNTKISTDQSKYGGSSIYFDGNGDYIQLPSNDFNLFADDFTLEFWVYTTDRSNRAILGFDFASAFYLDNKFLFWKDGIGEILSNNTTNYPLNTWVHVAYVRINGVLSLFQNGVKIAFGNMSGAIDLNSKLIGQRPYSNDFIGYLDSFRITKGIGRYTANFDHETDTFLNT